MKQTALYILIMVTLVVAGGCKKSTGGTKGAISGAGASFPFPLYSAWAYKYNSAKGIKVNYQSVGSGAGIAQIKKRTVDFGASDKPLKAKELKAHGLIQFPMAMGGVVPVVHLEGVKDGAMKLSGDVLAKIFLGEIKKWNDHQIVKLNAGLTLPDKSINVVHRADGSGTTWIFTNYLTKVSAQWKAKVGNGKSVSWPVGVGGKGNEGVAANVRKIDGAIGYVEYAYSLQAKLPAVALKNRAGSFVLPNITSFQAAAASADWKNAEGFYMVLTDQPGAASWPITGATFILIYKEQTSMDLAKRMLTYFDWCYQNGKSDAERLHYIPMPASVVSLIREVWRRDVTVKGTKVWK